MCESNNFRLLRIYKKVVTEGMDEKEALLPSKTGPSLQSDGDGEGKEVKCRETCVACLFPPRGGNFVDSLLTKPWYMRALRFLPALLLTLALELVNTAVLGSNQSWLRDHWLLVMFMPVISALAGNIGLQTSSSVSSAENVRREQQKPLPVWQARRIVSRVSLTSHMTDVAKGVSELSWA